MHGSASLAKHPKIKQAFKQGVDKFGVGAGASHLISGHTPAHQALEEVQWQTNQMIRINQ
jgi:7-keto-8-aminopelargonate synthetase-like enzyme